MNKYNICLVIVGSALATEARVHAPNPQLKMLRLERKAPAVRNTGTPLVEGGKIRSGNVKHKKYFPLRETSADAYV